MRIIAGKWKGKILKNFDFDGTKPTSDMVKQILFDCIGSEINNCVFCDLFSGTGSVGIEALSRGAKQVYFVDNNIKSIALIKKNIYSLNVNNYAINNCDFLVALNLFEKEKIKFDFIFIDPPYNTELYDTVLEKVKNSTIINENSIIILEHNKKINICDEYEIVKQKKQGIKMLTFLE